MTGGTLSLSSTWVDLLHVVGAQRRYSLTPLQSPLDPKTPGSGTPVANPGVEVPSDRTCSKFFVQAVGGVVRVRIPSMHSMKPDQAGADGSAAIAPGVVVYFEGGERDLDWIQARADSGAATVCFGICSVSSNAS